MTDDHSPKLLASLKKLAGTVVSMAQTRLELASVELAEEKSACSVPPFSACWRSA